MNLAKYDKYRNTGLDWLGTIPKHWEEKRIKDVFTIVELVQWALDCLQQLAHVLLLIEGGLSALRGMEGFR